MTHIEALQTARTNFIAIQSTHKIDCYAEIKGIEAALTRSSLSLALQGGEDVKAEIATLESDVAQLAEYVDTRP